MKRISFFLLWFVILGLGALSSVFFATDAFAGGASGWIDNNCMHHSGTFKVPQGKIAYNIRSSLMSPWLPCAGTGRPMRIGVRLRGPTGIVISYDVQSYYGKRWRLGPSLVGRELGPGVYTVEAPDGGINTRGSITFDLKNSAPPPPVAGGAPGWGSISGEWTDPTVRSKARITQRGNSMTITNTFIWEGKNVTWTGAGTVSGNNIRFNYRYTGYKPPLWENGTMTLTRMSRNSLKGSWTTSSGKYSQNIMFVRTKSSDASDPIEGHHRRGYDGHDHKADLRPSYDRNSIEGRWRWFNGGIADFKPDGACGVNSYWRAADPARRIFIITWNNRKWIDTLTLSPDGNRLEGTNQINNRVWGTRIIE